MNFPKHKNHHVGNPKIETSKIATLNLYISLYPEGDAVEERYRGICVISSNTVSIKTAFASAEVETQGLLVN